MVSLHLFRNNNWIHRIYEERQPGFATPRTPDPEDFDMIRKFVPAGRYDFSPALQCRESGKRKDRSPVGCEKKSIVRAGGAERAIARGEAPQRGAQPREKEREQIKPWKGGRLCK
jgi:hypothetical protein